jgi:hypothetical protein
MSADKPTEQSTRPDGNTPLRPSQLERGLGENVAAKLRADHSEQNKRMREHLAKKQTQSGHARR